jgi:outer membrane protein OmpA-like peptidoglycan-associated protein
MSHMSGLNRLSTFSAIALVGAALSFSAGISFAADDVTSDQILRALAPKKPLTRGLSMAPPTEPAVNAAEGKFVDTLRNRNTRSLSSGEREQIAVLAKSKPNIDLEITFEYNSADISARSQQSVQALGKALSSEDLRGSTFVVAGHTDGVGSDGYNQDLSERRAATARPSRRTRPIRWTRPIAASRWSTWPTRPLPPSDCRSVPDQLTRSAAFRIARGAVCCD